jgi:hypothetical protein
MARKPFFQHTSPAGFQFHRWELSDGDVGVPFHAPEYTDMLVHVFANTSSRPPSTFGTGATVTVQGSNDYRAKTDAMDGTETADWVVLTDPRGTPLALSSGSRMGMISEHPRFIRPIVSAGTGVRVSVVISGMKR